MIFNAEIKSFAKCIYCLKIPMYCAIHTSKIVCNFFLKWLFRIQRFNKVPLLLRRTLLTPPDTTKRYRTLSFGTGASRTRSVVKRPCSFTHRRSESKPRIPPRAGTPEPLNPEPLNLVVYISGKENKNDRKTRQRNRDP
jgi:hypothetical protein